MGENETMTALFKTPKMPKMAPPVKLEAPASPPSVTGGAAQEMAFLRSRRRKGSGLSSLILTPLGAGGNQTQPTATKQTLGS